MVVGSDVKYPQKLSLSRFVRECLFMKTTYKSKSLKRCDLKRYLMARIRYEK